MANSTIDVFAFDDITLICGKKEKSISRKVLNDDFKRGTNRTRKINLNKINYYISLGSNEKNILKKLVTDGKVLEIYESIKTNDGCLTIPAKINLKHPDFIHCLSEDVVIKCVLKGHYYFNCFAYSHVTCNRRKSTKLTCEGDADTNRDMVKESIEIINIENRVILLKSFCNGITLTQLIENVKLHSSKRMKIIKELLYLLHEISNYYIFGITAQNLDNIIFHNKKWIIVSTCSISYRWNCLEENLTQIATAIGPEFIKIFRLKFFTCEYSCIFSKFSKKFEQEYNVKFYDYELMLRNLKFNE